MSRPGGRGCSAFLVTREWHGAQAAGVACRSWSYWSPSPRASRQRQKRKQSMGGDPRLQANIVPDGQLLAVFRDPGSQSEKLVDMVFRLHSLTKGYLKVRDSQVLQTLLHTSLPKPPSQAGFESLYKAVGTRIASFSTRHDSAYVRRNI